MARDWQDLFITDDAGPPGAAAEEARSERRGGRLRRLRESLRKTRQALQTEIQATLFEDLSEATWERLEEALIYADVGASTTAKVVAQLERTMRSAAARSSPTGSSSCSPRSLAPARTGSTCGPSRR
jgi:fused signal recognition particle receptor